MTAHIEAIDILTNARRQNTQYPAIWTLLDHAINAVNEQLAASLKA